MKRIWLVTGVALLLLAGAPCFAQYSVVYQERPRWHFTGSLGFDLDKDSYSLEGIQPHLSSDSGYLQYGGDLQLSATGFWRDPRLLDFTFGFGQARSVSGSSRAPSEFGTGGRDISLVSNFLTGSGSPLTFSYIRTTSNLSGFGGRNDLNTSMAVNWRERLPHLPRADFEYRTSEFDTETPLFFTDNNTKSRSFAASSNGYTGGWRYGVSFSKNWLRSENLGPLAVSTPQKGHGTGLSGDLEHDFWHHKGTFSAHNDVTWQNFSGFAGSSDTRYTSASAVSSVQLTTKLNGRANYTFFQADAQTNFRSDTVLGTPVVLAIPSSQQHDADTGLAYTPLTWLAINGSVHYAFINPSAMPAEFIQSYLSPSVNVNLHREWHNVRYGLGYSLGEQFLKTSRDHSAHSYSQGVTGNLGWGRISNVLITGNFAITHQNVATLIGAFYNEKRYGIQAESTRIDGWRLSLRADQIWRETLSFAGDMHGTGSAMSLNAAKRWLNLNLTHTRNSGFGAIFPTQFSSGNNFISTLPIAQLVNTPLLNTTNRSTLVSANANLTPNLSLMATYTRTDLKLTNLHQSLQGITTQAQYRWGRFSFAAGYSNYADNFQVLEPMGRTHTGRNRFFFRFSRFFTIF